MCSVLSSLRELLRTGRKVGFVYASQAEDGPMANAAPGVTIRNSEDRPPWIVVDHSLESVVAAKWPGKLWKVEILQKATEQPRADAHYTRAVSVRVLEEEPISALFGRRGDRVCRVIETVGALTVEEDGVLGRPNPAAREAYSGVWRRWLAAVGADPSRMTADYADTLAVVIGGKQERSPVGIGLTVLYSALSERARALVGDEAFVTDAEGEMEFEPRWAATAEAFLHAAIAYGAPELTDEHDAEVLTSAWARHFERSK